MPQKAINFTAGGAGDNTIFTADATTSNTDLVDMWFTISAAGTVTLKDSGGTVYGVYTVGAAGVTIERPPVPLSARFSFKGNLIMNASGAMTVTGDFTYTPRMP